jgi:hypothetical protein
MFALLALGGKLSPHDHKGGVTSAATHWPHAGMTKYCNGHWGEGSGLHFKTIADFRKDNGKAIRKVCREFRAKVSLATARA